MKKIKELYKELIYIFYNDRNLVEKTLKQIIESETNVAGEFDSTLKAKKGVWGLWSTSRTWRGRDSYWRSVLLRTI